MDSLGESKGKTSGNRSEAQTIGQRCQIERHFPIYATSGTRRRLEEGDFHQEEALWSTWRNGKKCFHTDGCIHIRVQGGRWRTVSCCDLSAIQFFNFFFFFLFLSFLSFIQGSEDTLLIHAIASSTMCGLFWQRGRNELALSCGNRVLSLIFQSM